MTAEDKKRVLVESGAEAGGTLTMQKVTSAVRLLGSAFFQEYTSGRKDRGLKTYDQSAFNVSEEVPEMKMMIQTGRFLKSTMMKS